MLFIVYLSYNKTVQAVKQYGQNVFPKHLYLLIIVAMDDTLLLAIMRNNMVQMFILIDFAILLEM